MAPNVDLKIVAARTAGFAGADLANLVNEAALLAARNDKTAVDMKDFESAIDRLIAGLEKKRVMSTKEREIVAYHESGHAIVATVLPGLDPVHKISIVQRGFGALGYTMQLPLEDRYTMTRSELLGRLAVLLGGRSAEEIALGEISTGAQNDLQRATDIARAMVTEFGMSDALGAVNYDGNKRARFLDIPMPQERGLYGEETAQKIDAEIARILDEAHTTARRILEEHRDKLETITRRLLEVEVMEGDELRTLLGRPRPAPPPPPRPVFSLQYEMERCVATPSRGNPSHDPSQQSGGVVGHIINTTARREHKSATGLGCQHLMRRRRCERRPGNPEKLLITDARLRGEYFSDTWSMRRSCAPWKRVVCRAGCCRTRELCAHRDGDPHCSKKWFRRTTRCYCQWRMCQLVGCSRRESSTSAWSRALTRARSFERAVSSGNTSAPGSPAGPCLPLYPLQTLRALVALVSLGANRADHDRKIAGAQRGSEHCHCHSLCGKLPVSFVFATEW